MAFPDIPSSLFGESLVDSKAGHCHDVPPCRSDSVLRIESINVLPFRNLTLLGLFSFPLGGSFRTFVGVSPMGLGDLNAIGVVIATPFV